MDESVKTRAYHSNVRAVRAEQTRHAVLVAARDLFVQLGYDATTVTMVADRAGVAVDTVYASVGRKPQLAAAVVDMVLGASEEPVPAEERDYVKAIRAADGARRKIDLYADGSPARCPASRRGGRRGVRAFLVRGRGAPSPEHAALRSRPACHR